MIYPRAREYLLDDLKRKAERAVDERKTESEFTIEIAGFLRRVENSMRGLGDETTSNDEAFTLFLGKACATFGRFDTIRKIKEGILRGT